MSAPNPPQRPSLGRRLRFWPAIALAAVFCLSLAPSPVTRRSSTCVECRCDRAEWRCLVWAGTSEEATDMSLWYQGEVDPNHAHIWVPRGRCERFGIPGLYSGFACSGGHPVVRLSRQFQREIYEHFDDPREAGRLFASLADWDDESRAIFNSMSDWVEEGYPQPWAAWWERRRKGEADGGGP